MTIKFTLSESGHLGAWQRLNRVATIPHCVEQLEQSGTLDNLRRLTGRIDVAYRGQRFADSDVYKTLEAISWELGRKDDPAMRRFLNSTARLLLDVQEPDGYLNSWFQREPGLPRFGDLPWGHEMYCAGHLIQAAIASARAIGDRELMYAALPFADLLVRRFGRAGKPGVCGHPEIEMALVELYRLTGDRDALELASRMIDLRGRGLLGDTEFGRGYFQDHEPVRQAAQATGHAVRQLYLAAGATDVYLERRDTSLLRAMERLWDDVYVTKAYITGGVGSRHADEAFGGAYELPPDGAYAETCAAIAGFMWNWRLLLATGRARYADMMERTLLNAIACGVSMDGRHFFYVNPLEAGPETPATRQPWFDCACCPPNLARLVASMEHHVATSDDRGVQVHLYAAGRLQASGSFGDVVLDVDTAYPWQGAVRIGVHRSDFTWELSLRIPLWCENPGLRVNGIKRSVRPDSRGYVRLMHRWRAGDVVELDLPMPVRVVTADPRVESVRGRGALMRGPLVYCVESEDGPIEGVTLSSAQPPEAEPGPFAPVELAGDSYRAIPYFMWANRGPRPMKVWLPLA